MGEERRTVILSLLLPLLGSVIGIELNTSTYNHTAGLNTSLKTTLTKHIPGPNTSGTHNTPSAGNSTTTVTSTKSANRTGVGLQLLPGVEFFRFGYDIFFGSTRPVGERNYMDPGFRKFSSIFELTYELGCTVTMSVNGTSEQDFLIPDMLCGSVKPKSEASGPERCKANEGSVQKAQSVEDFLRMMSTDVQVTAEVKRMGNPSEEWPTVDHGKFTLGRGAKSFAQRLMQPSVVVDFSSHCPLYSASWKPKTQGVRLSPEFLEDVANLPRFFNTTDTDFTVSGK